MQTSFTDWFFAIELGNLMITVVFGYAALRINGPYVGAKRICAMTAVLACVVGFALAKLVGHPHGSLPWE